MRPFGATVNRIKHSYESLLSLKEQGYIFTKTYTTEIYEKTIKFILYQKMHMRVQQPTKHK